MFLKLNILSFAILGLFLIILEGCGCVSEKSKCGLNEVYDCGSACQVTCATRGTSCPIQNVKCSEGCFCKLGFLRNTAGVCVPVSNCPDQ
uniref:TIL domain-containing protein n=1 Tax=Glossina austeni TaxID=7395 RepID=A0A1A9UR14_GLOAU